MSTSLRAAKLHCELALGALERNPRDRWARERYEYLLRALEGVEADEIARAHNSRRVAANPATAA